MTIEELLIPRYVVELDYPQPGKDDDHKLLKGDIVMYLNVNGHMTYRRIRRSGWMSVGVPTVADPEKYPGVFRKLEWWEMRSEGEMPKYVKWQGDGKGRIAKARFDLEETSAYFMYLDEERIPYGLKGATGEWLPATEHEYLISKAVEV